MNEKLCEFLQQEIAGQTGRAVSLDDELLISGLLDSMGVVRLIDRIHDEFEIQIPPEEVTIENFQSVNRISDYLSKRSRPQS